MRLFSLQELEDRWGLSRNAIKKRAEDLGVSIWRPSSTEAYWPTERLGDGDRLNDWVQAGNPYKAFPSFSRAVGEQPAEPADEMTRIEQLERENAALRAALKELL